MTTATKAQSVKDVVAEGTPGLELSEAAREPSAASAPGLRWGLVFSYLGTIFMLITLNFFLPRLMPGDPISAMIGVASTQGTAGAETRQRLERYYALDRPLIEQYGHYLESLAKGDLGRSIRYNAPVARLIVERLGWTLLLSLTAIVMATLVGGAAGIHSGWRQGRQADSRLTAVFMGIHSIPAFFLASVVLFVGSVQLGWFPLGGAESDFANLSGLQRLADVAKHLVLPASIMAIQMASFQFLLMRSSMVSEAGADYLLAGRAKGLSDRRLKYRHAARNAMLPAFTHLSAQLGAAFTGAVFVERVFAYPGVGRLLFDSVSVRDYPVLQGCFLFLTLGVVGFNFLADLVYPCLDPRIVST